MVTVHPTFLFRLFIYSLIVTIIFSSCSSVTIEDHDDDGHLTASYKIKNDIKNGSYIGYHMDGSIFEESTYVQGQVHGLRVLYYEGDKKIQTIETYDHGIMAGLFEEYHRNGQVAFTGIYVDNAMDGIWKKYDETGLLIEEVTFKDNEENGSFKEYHTNGQLAAEGGYLNGDKEHGPLKMYNDKGELIKEMACENGVCRTIWIQDKSK